MSTDPFNDIQASLFAFCRKFSDDMRAASIADLAIFKYDAFAEVSEFPEQDIIGVAHFTLDVNDGLVEVTGVIGVSTFNDENTFRLDQLIGQLLGRLKPGTLITVVDAATNQPYGKIKLKGNLKVLPVELTSIRPLRGIAIAAGSDRAFPS
jgi:hypothetical protein